MPYSTFLNGRDATQLRGLQWLSFTDSGVVEHRGGSSDAGGGATVAWTTGGTTPCRIDPVNGRSGVTGGRIDERSTHVVRVPSGMTVSSDDRFAIAGRGTYQVTVTRERTDAWLMSFEVIQLS